MRRIFSLSATGIRISFPGEVGPELQANELFETLIEIQAQEKNLEFRTEVVYYEYNKALNLTICGCRFVDLQRPTQLTISRFVTFLQREGMA